MAHMSTVNIPKEVQIKRKESLTSGNGVSSATLWKSVVSPSWEGTSCSGTCCGLFRDNVCLHSLKWEGETKCSLKAFSSASGVILVQLSNAPVTRLCSAEVTTRGHKELNSHFADQQTLECSHRIYVLQPQIACLMRLNTEVSSDSHTELSLNENLRASYFKSSVSDSFRASICRQAHSEWNHPSDSDATPKAQYTKNDT